MSAQRGTPGVEARREGGGDGAAGPAGGWRTVLAAAVALVVLLGITALFALRVAGEMGEVAVGIHPFIAIGSGVAVMILLGALLLRLTHVSHRRGHDEKVGKP
ncbi:hypothetical protein SH611_10770 [Geminicoccaceae bacterium 1502E]|nr:hypothetical protein [Geminicoccaceae bacterium 1502E]